MNNKGEGKVTAIVLAVVAVIVALVLFQASAAAVNKANPSTTTTILNRTVTATLNVPVEVPGQELVSTLGITNGTSGTAIPAANYTLAECIKTSDGLKGICYTGRGVGANTEGKAGVGTINVSYSYYPEGYADDSGSRAIIGIIILLAAVAIGFILVPMVADNLKEL